MMKCMVKFHDFAKKVILESPADQKITWVLVYNQLKDQFYKLTQLKFMVKYLLKISKF